MKTSMDVHDEPLIEILPGPTLTAEQELKYDTLLGLASQWNQSFDGSPLAEHERRWITRECLIRYLRACKWITEHSLARLKATILWRREQRIDDLTAEGPMLEELSTGRLIPLGYDKTGRPCLYYNLLKDTPELSHVHLSHLFFMTERAIDMMHPGVESITVIIDLRGASRSLMPSMTKLRAYIAAFQEHNPERLGLAILPTAIPWWFNSLWKIMRLFIDPAVKKKIKLNREASHYITKDQLWTDHGGSLDFELDDDYWDEFLGEAGKRRGEYVKRWEAAGKRLGESEEYLRGGGRFDDGFGINLTMVACVIENESC
ncbi:related to PDR16 protein [Ramularia collo-cygni]|uniref:Related to PDR16 protein n=1 Tax=Ramularia collo-cygni TaxID=112498 RepID=A0A2D3VAV2_9PEZI|nr:related to PDR16 protein [Ramularia collo-cygni]CZT20806.1 related to PDR16 protein [Ramularia collo-cygni]